MTKGVSRNSWVILKQVWNMAGNDNSNWAECGNISFEGYKSILQRYFGIGSWDEDQAIYCLTAKYNADYNEEAGDSPNPFENIGPDEVLIPKIYKYVIEHNKDEYETEYYLDDCDEDGKSYDYEEDCQCEYATTEKYFEESEEYEEEECDFEYDDDCRVSTMERTRDRTLLVAHRKINLLFFKKMIICLVVVKAKLIVYMMRLVLF